MSNTLRIAVASAATLVGAAGASAEQTKKQDNIDPAAIEACTNDLAKIHGAATTAKCV